MKALVTGASGRLGRYVVAELESAGHELVLMSRTRPEAADRWPWVEGSIVDSEACMRATGGGVEAVQHVAATPYPTDHPETRQRAEERGVPFDETMRTNIMGTYYLLQAAVARKINIFVMTGSNCALGHGFRISGREFPLRYLPVDEAHLSEVEDSYSYSKLVGEELLAMYTRAYGIRTHVLRSAGICNAERREGIASNASPARAWDPWLWAWIGSEDIAAAHRLLMEKAEEIEPDGVYFCNGDDTTALEPTRELIARFKPELADSSSDEGGHWSLLSNKKLRETLGWEPRTSWRDSLEKS
ncbi:MAG: NAD(P)-dependent oxidoreductase [Armatimonadota bacterium]|nr:MAG: NAD(P)-dependent oxidoreductase [Armatimonadota bacterium]